MDQGISTNSLFDSRNVPSTSHSNSDSNILPGQQAMIVEIVEYFQGKMTKDMENMAGHIINAMASNSLNPDLKELENNMEKLKCIIRIQHVLIKLTNLINNV